MLANLVAATRQWGNVENIALFGGILHDGLEARTTF